MARRLYPADDVAVKAAFLRSDPVTKNIISGIDQRSG
jgi:iron complex transport system substrate-binding protein